jgi:hypothetical protein
LGLGGFEAGTCGAATETWTGLGEGTGVFSFLFRASLVAKPSGRTSACRGTAFGGRIGGGVAFLAADCS